MNHLTQYNSVIVEASDLIGKCNYSISLYRNIMHKMETSRNFGWK